MTQISETQSLILSAASQRPDFIALPLPANLRGGAAAKVVVAMKRAGFLEEAEADMRKDELVWRETGDGHGVTLVATAKGLAAIGIEQADAIEHSAKQANETAPAPDAASAASSPAPARARREGTKQAQVISMLSRPDGATTKEIAEATGWQAHTVRSTLSHTLQKRLGFQMASEDVAERGRVHRIIAQP